MRRVVGCAAAVCVALGAVLAAQSKVTTVSELDSVMKKAGAFREVDKAIQSSNAAGAKAQLAIVRQAVQDSQSFWITHRKDDAVKFNKESLAKIDALDTVLSSGTLDVAAATAAYKETGGSCRACHSQYRAEDENNAYILKPGSVPGISH